ncbi:hypothetical protein BB559_005600 [Furculomyces boomerangus]|uniref:VOC domain-containing protein n=2 Tax=Harpellales TaxID=61421 RepID=A0A2T9Y7P1_9FUNG|nr:hypothetical protein BB559_006841 [Furculomyces boomerangus]PVU88351.1 hypothetical protein BB559_005600 [Furculomyces boomerangus]PVZ96801.1 hypothetical protein BB558_007280 [Smittium angustum]
MFRTVAKVAIIKKAVQPRNPAPVNNNYNPPPPNTANYPNTNPTYIPAYNPAYENAYASVDPFLSNLGHVNYIAIATRDIEKSIHFWRTIMGATKVSGKMTNPEHGVYTVFVDLGQTKIKLMQPIDEKSPISGFFQQNPTGGIHHICINVSDLALAIQKTKDNNIRSLGEATIGAHGFPVILLNPQDCGGVLIELEEHK